MKKSGVPLWSEKKSKCAWTGSRAQRDLLDADPYRLHGLPTWLRLYSVKYAYSNRAINFVGCNCTFCFLFNEGQKTTAI